MLKFWDMFNINSSTFFNEDFIENDKEWFIWDKWRKQLKKFVINNFFIWEKSNFNIEKIEDIPLAERIFKENKIIWLRDWFYDEWALWYVFLNYWWLKEKYKRKLFFYDHYLNSSTIIEKLKKDIFWDITLDDNMILAFL